jgi:hypothetical protein
MKTKYKYINFSQTLHKWRCYTNRGNDELGFLEWNQRWKQYEFVPAAIPVAFTQDCLMDIADFIRQIETEKKAGVKNENNH